MLRSGLGLVAGVVLAMAVMIAWEFAGHQLFPPPAGLDPARPEDLARMVAAASMAAKAWVVAGWFLAPLAGGWLARRLARRDWAGWVVAGLVVIGGLANVMMIPHPLWMQVAAVIAPLLAGWLVWRLPTAKPGIS